MSIYVYTSLFLSAIMLFSGFFIYQKYKKSSGFFYLLFAILFPIWFLLYSFSFDSSLSQEFITRVYRFQYSLSIIGFYSVLFFILFYGILRGKFSHHIFPIFVFYGTIFFLSNFTSLIVEGVQYNINRGIYVEIYGALFGIFAGLYGLLVPLFIIVSFYKFKTLSYLYRTRLLIIIFGFFCFIVISLLFNVFIPFLSEDSSKFYGEMVFPFFIIPFILSVLYASYKYDFSSYKMYLNNIFCYGFAAFFTFLWLELFQIFSFIILKEPVITNLLKFNFGWGEIFLSLVLFSLFLKISKRFHLQNIIQEKLLIIQEKLPFITGEKNISHFLKNEFYNELAVQETNLVLGLEKKQGISKLFSQDRGIKYIINDFVFFQKHKHKVSESEIKREIGESSCLIFPIFRENKELIAVLFLGKKRFGDAYTTQEIIALQSFTKFLGGYLKYLSVYRRLQDISLHLDKKVDEKTIQYNNLLNKQKEFIAYIGHEIKNPITNTIFLCDSLREEIHGIRDIKLSERLIEDGAIMYDELIKVSNLVKQIFSTQQFDLEKIKLYKKRVEISELIKEEVFTFKSVHPSVKIRENIENIGCIELDVTQFRQVLHNLLGNALKFANQSAPEISIKTGIEQNGEIILEIEDNGNGFNESEMEGLFDKYSTGEGDLIGLGMGLYLCKKIVELHGGNILARKSNTLGGACFIIKL